MDLGTYGYPPPDGARIQCPDIILVSSQSYTGVSTSRTYVTTTNAGSVYFENVMLSDRFRLNLDQVKTARLTNVGAMAPFIATSTTDIEASGVYVSKDRLVASAPFTFTSVSSRRMDNCFGSSYADDGFNLTDCNGINFYNCKGVTLVRDSTTADRMLGDEYVDRYTHVSDVSV